MPIDASKETYVEYRLNLQDDGNLDIYVQGGHEAGSSQSYVANIKPAK